MSSPSRSDQIPNNVDLAGDKQLQRALEAWQPNFIDWWKEMGPDGFQEDDIYLRTAISVDQRGLGALRLREDARLPLGHLPRRPGAGPHDRLRRSHGRARLAAGAGRAPQRAPPPHRHAGRHRAGERRAAAPARPDVPERLRPPQPLPGERRGGAPPLGDGLPAPQLLRPRRARGGRGPARAPQRRRRQAAHPRRLQRAVHRLALVLHVHVLHRSRRQVPAPRARRERLRPARRARRASCSPRRRTTCSSARRACCASSSAPRS